MKYLKESEYKIKDEALKIEGKCRQYSTSEQAHMLSMISSSDFEDRLGLGKYALENCITELSVDGSNINIEKFAQLADLSDDTTLKVYLAVGELCSVANRLEEEEEKK